MADQTPPALSLTRRSLLLGGGIAAAAASLPVTLRATAQTQPAAAPLPDYVTLPSATPTPVPAEGSSLSSNALSSLSLGKVGRR